MDDDVKRKLLEIEQLKHDNMILDKRNATHKSIADIRKDLNLSMKDVRDLSKIGIKSIREIEKGSEKATVFNLMIMTTIFQNEHKRLHKNDLFVSDRITIEYMISAFKSSYSRNRLGLPK